MYKLFYILIFCIVSNNIYAQDVIIIDTEEDISEKEALVILNGFGDSKKNRRIQKEFFQEKGYDLFIPEYVKKKSLDLTISTFSYLCPLPNRSILFFILFLIDSTDENFSAANSECAKVFNFNEISSGLRILLKCQPALLNI